MIAAGTRVLVTGATGFIGGRLVERLAAECHADVHVLVRSYARVPRIARFQITMHPGEVTQPDHVKTAMEGCDLVFHCAFGNAGTPDQQRTATVGGTRSVMEAALAHKVKMLIHISTVSVYGRTDDGDLDETAPRRKSGEVYADSKVEAERLAFDYHRKHGLPVSIVQPTIVYGPFGGTWTVNPLSQLKSHRVVLVNGGTGLCNAVYVDDVVDALLLASHRPEAIGQAFLISGAEPVSWKDFYAGYEHMLGFQSTASLTAAEVSALLRSHRKSQSTTAQIRTAIRENPLALYRFLQLPAVSGAYRLGRRLAPSWLLDRVRASLVSTTAQHQGPPQRPAEKPLTVLTEAQSAFLRARTRVRIDKARQILGYNPAFSIEEGMKLTESWARYSNLL